MVGVVVMVGVMVMVMVPVGVGVVALVKVVTVGAARIGVRRRAAVRHDLSICECVQISKCA